MMYRSLKILNRPVEYVGHPGASHEITRSGDNRQALSTRCYAPTNFLNAVSNKKSA